jgi:hypothetical protein
MKRKEVYKRLDAERKYQDIVGESGRRGDTPDEEKPVAEWVNYIEYHLSKAKDYVYHLRKDNALEELRKVAALAVRAMEIHGCPERRMPTRIGGINTQEEIEKDMRAEMDIIKSSTTCCDGNSDCKKK